MLWILFQFKVCYSDILIKFLLNGKFIENTVFLAGGVGITLALSMLRQMYAQERHRKVVLFWGLNTSAELAFQKELEKMGKEMDHFVTILVVLNDKTWTGEKGYID